jgi:hypothetical protein
LAILKASQNLNKKIGILFTYLHPTTTHHYNLHSHRAANNTQELYQLTTITFTKTKNGNDHVDIEIVSMEPLLVVSILLPINRDSIVMILTKTTPLMGNYLMLELEAIANCDSSMDTAIITFQNGTVL